MKNYVSLGKSDVKAHPIGLGSNAVGGRNIFPNVSDEEGRNIVRAALESGITMLDTAFSYGPRYSEEIIGEVVQEYKREDVVIATKAAHKYTDEKEQNYVFDNSPAFLKQSVEESLRRLKSDYIDLFYIHFPDEDTPKDEAVGALHDLKLEGKIRAIGVSNFSFKQLKEANKDGYVDVIQSEYNLLKRSAEKDFLPYAVENQITFIPYFPLELGLLTGKYHEKSTFNDFRAQMPNFQGSAFKKNLQKVEELREIATSKEEEVAHIVLAWYLTQKTIDVIIPGAKRIEQVKGNIRAAEIQLTDDEVAKINSIF
ncbi:aldo/keto reductase [Sutcliffiella rhizosphaerae]|uniref:Aldo-keto reductase IolS n=1 Tax=Sutcliffiella rhizosphaerae TaxID=2880967 RepID=A0ABM8YUP6_9BACI|nr:aldo/keto reductase [Sutcliffiella rhizosphaerae]CAG9623653.1 Aldo-keto reductase IolS [Sutcliffiella rhizosphaerae]